jgi:hypothetical protein
MRPPLFGAGLLVMATGAGFYVLVLPIVSVWGVPMVIGGAVMSGAGLLLPEGRGPVQPPEGFRFCVFCTTPVPIASERCPHCNGLQPKEGA